MLQLTEYNYIFFSGQRFLKFLGNQLVYSRVVLANQDIAKKFY